MKQRNKSKLHDFVEISDIVATTSEIQSTFLLCMQWLVLLGTVVVSILFIFLAIVRTNKTFKLLSPLFHS